MNRELKPVASEGKCSVGEFWRTHVSVGIVRRSDAFFRDAKEVGVEFAVGIFVVVDRDGVGSGLHGSELADAMLAAGRGNDAGLSGIRVLGKALRRLVKRTPNLSLIAAQSVDLDLNDSFGRRGRRLMQDYGHREKNQQGKHAWLL